MVIRSEEEPLSLAVGMDEESAVAVLDGEDWEGRVGVGRMPVLFNEAQMESTSMVVPAVEARGFLSLSFSLQQI